MRSPRFQTLLRLRMNKMRKRGLTEQWPAELMPATSIASIKQNKPLLCWFSLKWRGGVSVTEYSALRAGIFKASIRPPGYPSAWLRPSRARFRFARQDHCRSTTSIRLNFRFGRDSDVFPRERISTVPMLERPMAAGPATDAMLPMPYRIQRVWRDYQRHVYVRPQAGR
jgi:hypothetical protein